MGVDMKIYTWPIKLFLLVLITASFNSQARKMGPSVIKLKICNIEIVADKISYFNDTISYSGNVQFLYGLASVKTENLLMIKKKDGSCQLIAEQNGNSKNIR